MVTPAGKRDAVAHLRTAHAVSEWRACRVLDIDRSLIRYQSRRPRDGHIRARLRELSGERKRFGSRHLHILLMREGLVVNHKTVQRLYREEGLSVRKRGGRKRAMGTRAPIAVPTRGNERWPLDFVSDAFMDGRRLRILCIVDGHSRECLALVADTSPSGHRLARELNMLITKRGRPHTIVRDNGTEMTSNAILKWQEGTGINRHYNDQTTGQNCKTRTLRINAGTLGRAGQGSGHLPLSPGAQRRVFGVVQGRLERDKDSSPSVHNDRVGAGE